MPGRSHSSRATCRCCLSRTGSLLRSSVRWELDGPGPSTIDWRPPDMSIVRLCRTSRALAAASALSASTGCVADTADEQLEQVAVSSLSALRLEHGDRANRD